MGATGTILRAELLALRHRFRQRGGVRNMILVTVIAIAGLTFGAGVFAVSAGIGYFTPALIGPALAGGFSTLSVLMLILGFPTVIATFFVGRDLLQLVVAPVRTRDIFMARLAVAMSANLLMSTMLLVGVAGLGVGARAPLAYFLAAIPLIALQVVTLTALQALLMSAVLRVLPARVARDAAAALAGITGAGLYVVWSVNFRTLLSTNGQRLDLSRMTALTQRVDWLPTSWPGHALTAILTGNPAAAAGWSAGTLALAVGSLALGMLLYRQTLLAGLGVFGGAPQLWRRRTTSVPRAAAPPVRGGLGSPLAAIAAKDWLSYRRDIRRLSRLLPAFLFPIGYAIALGRSPRGATLVSSGDFLVAFMALFIATAVALPAIPSERRGFLLLRLAPISTWELLRAKLLLSVVPVLALTLVFTAAVSVLDRSTPSHILASTILDVWLAAGYVTCAVSAGAIDPRFDAADDRRAVGLAGSLGGTFSCFAFGLLSMGAYQLLGLDTMVSTYRDTFGTPSPMEALGVFATATSAGLLIAAAGLAGVMLWLGHRRLNAWSGTIETAA